MRGISPGPSTSTQRSSSSGGLSGGPIIVQVVPDPVWPYAKSEQLKPSHAWRSSVKRARDRCYYLDFFTMRELLLLDNACTDAAAAAREALGTKPAEALKAAQAARAMLGPQAAVEKLVRAARKGGK